MKKYLVIGNPINHSLSPKLHNYWLKKNKINAIYERLNLNENDIKEILKDLKNNKIQGLNVTVPFKKNIIPYLDSLSSLAEQTQSVNTIYKLNDKIIGHNTDVGGFELAIRKINYNIKEKIIFILGAGGVAPSIILALKKMNVGKIILSNRTKQNALYLKDMNPDLEILNRGEVPEFDMIINATSLGLKNNDEIKLDFNKIGNNKFFFDVIYNPKETKFLSEAKKMGNQTENGKMMFIYQAHQAFGIWHKILPIIDDDIIKMLDHD